MYGTKYLNNQNFGYLGIQSESVKTSPVLILCSYNFDLIKEASLN